MKIGIANDSPLAAEALRRALTLVPEHKLLWIARDGVEAVENCAAQTPDVILMDLIMPRMDGVEATRRIMAATPCTILIVTSSVELHTPKVFEAMGYGALDAVDTPTFSSGDPAQGAAALLTKLRTIGKLHGEGLGRTRPALSGRPARDTREPLIAIGASAGGPAALALLLEGLPRELTSPVIIVQHVDERFVAGMADWLGRHSKLPVRLARDGEPPARGEVLIAGTGDHLALTGPDRLGYTPDPKDYVYRPSVDVFFHSVARFWPGKAIGVLLTGMGSDGAKGLKALRDAGHLTIAQDQASSAVYGMPKAAAALGAAAEILPLDRIAARLYDAAGLKLARGVSA
jgi:two-component system response regulator WspF